jgi:YidC/Oxa1 family membrane protein insertase
MEKRVLFAVLLSFAVLAGYQLVVPQPKRPQKSASTAASSTAASANTPASQASSTPESSEPPKESAPVSEAPQPESTPLPAAVVGDVQQRSIVVETETVTATFDNRGAEITSWRLKKYQDESGRPVDLLPSALPPTVARPFELKSDDAGVTKRLNDGLYRVQVNGQPAGDRIRITAPTTLSFELQDAEGLVATKTFKLEPGGYVLRFSSTVRLGTRELNPLVLWGPGMGDTTYVVGEKSSNSYVQRSQGIFYDKPEGKVHRLTPKDVLADPMRQTTFTFAGIDDHYFIATLVQPGVVRVAYRPETAALPNGKGQRELISWSVLFAHPPRDVSVFVGPKDFDVLKAVDPLLVKAIHFGMWDFFAVPLLHALKWINGYIGNYGWSIVILTILINLAIFPLRHKSVVSMRRMQELQPQIKAIQDRYKHLKATDPERQKMNQELMGLYRERGVNPASGCLPMILTMPILFAFYSLLSVAIEMRGAPFALWIKDLSVHDPYYITPIIMAGTMLWQQRMTPVTDSSQQKIMMLTPLIFLTFFLWAPSGLVIYWTVSNLLGIGQQLLTNRIIGAPVVEQVRPPAERRIKNAGGGSTEAARKAAGK